MQRLRRRAALSLGILVLASILVAQPATLATTSGAARAAGAAGSRFTAVDGGPLFDVVTDGSGRAYATNPSRNRIEVLSIATGTLEAPIAVGPEPRGLDLSPDGSRLYVANNGANYVSVVDLALRREVRRISVPVEPWSSDRPWAIAVTADGRALMTTSFDTTGGVIRQIDLADGTVTPLPEPGDPGFVGSRAQVKASGDRSTIGIIQLSRVALFSVASNSFIAQKDLEFQPQIALDGTGSRVLIGKYVLDRDLGLRATIPAEGSSGVVVDHGGTTGYRATGIAVDVLDLERGLLSGTIALPTGGGSTGAVALSRDEGSLVVLTGNGISVVPVSGAVPTACTTPTVAANVLAVCGGPLAEVVTGPGGRAFASHPGRNQIEVINLAGRTLEAPIPVGSDPRGLGLGPDGNTLYVANFGGEDISVVDLTLRREVRRIVLPSGPAMWQPSSVAVAGNGTALVVVGTSSVRKLLQLRLATSTVVDRIDGPGFASGVWANRNNTKIAVADGANVWLYDAAGDTYGQQRQIDDTIRSLAFDAAGSRILLDSDVDTFLLDGDRNMLGTLPGGRPGVAMQRSGALGYHVRETTVDVLDLGRFLPVATLDLPEPVGSGSGVVALSGGESIIAVLTEHGVSIASVTSAVPNPPCATPPPRQGVAAVCGQLVDVVTDSGHAYATNRERNQVEVVSLATGTAEAAIPVGSQPMGLDLSPDGTMLYVANWGGSQISVIDLALRREVRRITVPADRFPTFPTERPSWIAVLNDGTALLTTHHHTQGTGGRMLQINLADGTVRRRTDFDNTHQADASTRLKHSGDRSRVVVVDSSSSSGNVFLYRADTDSFGPDHLLNRFVGSAAVDAAGANVLVEPGGFVLNGDLVVQRTIATTARAAAINAAGTTGYSVRDSDVAVSDLARGAVTRRIPLPEPVGSGSGAALTPDGDTLAVLTASGLSVVSAVIPSTPSSVWTQPSTAPLDALGAWIYPANDPKAAAGQRPPTYSYAHYFGFANSTALGGVALVSDPSGKLALFNVTEPNGTQHTAGVPFDWRAGQYYFLFVYQSAPGTWAAWIFDNTASTWVPVGQLALPSAWGKLSPTSATAAVWYGPGGARCSAYPRADVFFYRPIGYVGGAPAEAALVTTTGSQPGTCPAEVPPLSGGWARYRMGADAVGP